MRPLGLSRVSPSLAAGMPACGKSTEITHTIGRRPFYYFNIPACLLWGSYFLLLYAPSSLLILTRAMDPWKTGSHWIFPLKKGFKKADRAPSRMNRR
jgi:hypothetical protein